MCLSSYEGKKIKIDVELSMWMNFLINVGN